MTNRWTRLWLVALPCAALAAFSGVGCSDGDDGSGGAGGGSGGAGGSGGMTSSSSSNSSSSTGGGCTDTMTDPLNCGSCGFRCAPGMACEAGVCMCGTTNVAFADVQAIFTNSCTASACHSGAAPKAGLDLTDGNAYDQIVNVASSQCGGASRTRIVPGDPMESYLVDKLMNVDKCTGSRMPPTIALPTDKIQVISDWVCGGAMMQ